MEEVTCSMKTAPPFSAALFVNVEVMTVTVEALLTAIAPPASPI